MGATEGGGGEGGFSKGDSWRRRVAESRAGGPEGKMKHRARKSERREGF